MPQVVQIPGIGTQTFPDDATPDEIEAALNEKYPISSTAATEQSVAQTPQPSLLNRASKWFMGGGATPQGAPETVTPAEEYAGMQQVEQATPQWVKAPIQAAGETLSGFVPRSVGQVAQMFLPPAQAVTDIQRAYQAVNDWVGGKPIDQIDKERFPESQVLVEADKTPPFSKERWKAGFDILAQMGMAAGLTRGIIRPGGEITDAKQFSKTTPVYGDVLDTGRPQESVGEMPATEGGVGVPARGQGDVVAGEAPETAQPVAKLSPEITSELARRSKTNVEDGLPPLSLSDLRDEFQQELSQTGNIPKFAGWAEKRQAQIAELDKAIAAREAPTVPQPEPPVSEEGQSPTVAEQPKVEGGVPSEEEKAAAQVQGQEAGVLAPTAAAEPTAAAAAPAEIPPEDVKYTGVANRVYERLAKEGQLGDVPTGAGRSTADSIAIGRRRLSEGADPNEIASRFWKTRRISDNEFAVLRAHSENLHGQSLAAEKAMRTNPTPENTAAYEQAFQAFHDFSRNVVQPAKTATSNIFRAMQDEEPIHVDTYTGMREAMLRDKGRDVKPQERPVFEKSAENIQAATRERNGAVATIDRALKTSAPKARRVVTTDDLRTHIADLMKRRFPCG